MNSLKNILFLDIETVSQTYDYGQLTERMKSQWARKASFLKRDEATTNEDIYLDRAGIYAEFGKVVAVAVGFFVKNKKGDLSLKVRAMKNDDESDLLQDLNTIFSHFKADELRLCAHNGKEFDFPYLCRRMLVNNVKLPSVLDVSGKKPWEVNHLDTMELWKFGDWKHFTSLDLLAEIFDIPSSKTDMDGSMVNATYHENNDLDKIADYCKRDVVVLAQLYLKLKGMDGFNPDNVVYVD